MKTPTTFLLLLRYFCYLGVRARSMFAVWEPITTLSSDNEFYVPIRSNVNCTRNRLTTRGRLAAVCEATERRHMHCLHLLVSLFLIYPPLTNTRDSVPLIWFQKSFIPRFHTSVVATSQASFFAFEVFRHYDPSPSAVVRVEHNSHKDTHSLLCFSSQPKQAGDCGMYHENVCLENMYVFCVRENAESIIFEM